MLCSPSLPAAAAAGLGTTLVLSTLIHLLTLLQQLEDWSDVVREQVLGHQAVNGKPEANQDRHDLFQPAAAVRGKLMPTAADELEVAEQVEEEAGLIGYQQVKQDVVLQAHRLQEDQEGGVRVDTGVQLRLLSAAERVKLTVSKVYLYSSIIKSLLKTYCLIQVHICVKKFQISQNSLTKFRKALIFKKKNQNNPYACVGHIVINVSDIILPKF